MRKIFFCFLEQRIEIEQNVQENAKRHKTIIHKKKTFLSHLKTKIVQYVE